MAIPGSQGSPVAPPTAGRAPVQWAALAAGAVFAVVGVAGFVPGLTTDYGAMTFAGHHAAARLLGIFEVSVLHNIVHLLFAVLGLALAATFNGARGFLIGAGVLYLLLCVYGVVVEPHSAANVLPVNGADNWLHLGLGVILLGLGLGLGRGAQGRVGG